MRRIHPSWHAENGDHEAHIPSWHASNGDHEAHRALLGMVGGGELPVIGLPVSLMSYYTASSHPSVLGGPSPGWLTVLVNGAAVRGGCAQQPGLRTGETCGWVASCSLLVSKV